MIKKLIITATILFFAFTANCQTTAEWQSDLRWLQQTVHSKYNNLFYNISPADWDKAVDEFYTSMPGLNKQQIITGFVKLIALFHIGHTLLNTSVLHPNPQGLQLHRYPYQLYWFSDGLYIERTDNKYANAVGGRVIKIGNMKSEDALQAVRPLVSYENEQGYKSNSVAFLSIPEFMQTVGITNTADEVSITYSKNGKIETAVFTPGNNDKTFGYTGLLTPEGWVDAKQPGNTPLWQKEPAALRYMEYIPVSRTLYIRHSATMDDNKKSIAAFFNDMADFIEKNDVQKLILDIRMNSGGNNYLNKPIITSIIESKKINHKGKLFCIIGRRTFSAAQDLANELQKYTEVTFVGEPTSENVNFYGDPKTETLPNSKLGANLSSLWWQDMDPRDKRKSTSPNIPVDMSYADYYNNNDPAMEAISNYDKMKTFIPRLVELVNSGKKAEALNFATTYKKDPMNKYYIATMATDINTEGYKILKENPALANSFFEINIKLFPESANAFDSYAESFMRMGKKDEAVKYYEMAIEKDKDGTTADNSRRMIENIKKGN
jgi:tetratricopeptide (TPR) repeat protein